MRRFIPVIFLLCLLAITGLNAKANAPAVKLPITPASFDWTDASLRSVFMLNASDAWSVGQGGTIVHWDGAAWKTVTSPTWSWLQSVYMLDANDGWAVGTEGSIIRWNGTAWDSITSPTAENLYEVFMTNASDGWAVGWNGKMIRWDGNSWSMVTGPITTWLDSVYMTNTTYGWAVGSSGKIIRWNGTAWSTVTSPTSNLLHSVFMVNASDGWAVGSNGAIIHWDGTEWNNVTSPTTQTLRSVFMINTSDGWAVGDFGTALRWNGTEWNTVTCPMFWLFSAYMLDANDGWAVGDFGAIVHWNGTEWISSQSPVYLGDLTLSDSDVYIIEGRFDINGSIIIEENATLILRNALLNFTQEAHNQFNIILQNPVDGNPRLIVENASIATNGYDLDMHFHANSTAEINELSTTLPYVDILLYDEASVKMSNSTCEHVGAQHSSVISASNSSFYQIAAWDYAKTTISNCTLNCIYAGGNTNFTLTKNCTIIDDVQVNAYNLNYSVNGLKPGFISYWNFPLNCSATGIWVPNLTVEDTHVGGWSFYSKGHSNVTISNSELYILTFNDFSHGVFHIITMKELATYDHSEILGFDSMSNRVYLYGNSIIWAINSTTTSAYYYGQSKVYVCWYLDVHVIDSIGQNVPSANVTATYPNTTLAESKLTGANGWTRLTLMQAMANATGYYPIGTYTVQATYQTYLNITTVDMTGNQQIALTLEDFVVPEFPSTIILPLFMIATLLAVIVCRRKHFL
jgi:hypothetical protein